MTWCLLDGSGRRILGDAKGRDLGRTLLRCLRWRDKVRADRVRMSECECVMQRVDVGVA